MAVHEGGACGGVLTMGQWMAMASGRREGEEAVSGKWGVGKKGKRKG